MARLTERLSYLRTRLDDELVRHREAFASEIERRLREQIAAGEGQRPYSRTPTWFNIRAIPRFEARLSSRRNAQGRFMRSRFGGASLFLPGGYAEFRQVVGRPTSPVDFHLTGEFLAALKGRAVRGAGGGLHAWVAFSRQRRSYGRLTNSQLADVLARRSGVDPFRMDVIGREMADKIVDSVLVSTGAR